MYFLIKKTENNDFQKFASYCYDEVLKNINETDTVVELFKSDKLTCKCFSKLFRDIKMGVVR
jgi:hypothetical protein